MTFYMHKSTSVALSCCRRQQSFVTSKLAYWKTDCPEQLASRGSQLMQTKVSLPTVAQLYGVVVRYW